MKKNLFLLGTLPVALLTAVVVINSGDTPEGNYETREASNIYSSGQDAYGMFEFYNMMRGDMTKENYLRLLNEVKSLPSDRSTISWTEQGPDNIGGRTRAIIVDKDDVNVVYAGSVSGGLFKSINRANYWEVVPEFNENLAISSMCQTEDGRLYIGTGHKQEQVFGSFSSGAQGMGVYYMNPDGTFTSITGTVGYDWVNEVVCDSVNNRVWIACDNGLMIYDASTGSLNPAGNGLPTGDVTAVDISPDGEVIVCAKGSNQTYVSTDFGASFNNYSSVVNTTNPIPSSDVSRLEYSISDVKENGKYFIYATQSKGNIPNSRCKGIYLSQDNGLNWTIIAPENDGSPGSFAPFGSAASGQGIYNMTVVAGYQNPNKMLVGGLNLFSWGTANNWAQLSQSFAPITSDLYVHADNHELYWDQWGRLYVGNDGGVFISDDGGQSFYPANRGYNVTQFFGIGASGHGDVIGGAQDNGSLANYHDGTTWREFRDVMGGDGFSNEMAFTNRDLSISSSQYGFIGRSADHGDNTTGFMPIEWIDGSAGCSPGDGASACGPFFTKFLLWENPNDLNSKDSIDYVPAQAYLAGEDILIPSKTTQMTIPYTTTINTEFEDTVYHSAGLTTQDTIVVSLQGAAYNINQSPYAYMPGFTAPIAVTDSIELTDIDDTIEVASISLLNHYYATNPSGGKILDMGNDSIFYGISWDTLRVQDPYQSWFVTSGVGGVWMTRNALRFASPSNQWFNVIDGSLGTITAMEFSRNGDYLFLGTSGGKLYRFTGFNDVYSPIKDYGTNGTYTVSSPDPGTGIFIGDTLIDIITGNDAPQTTLVEITPAFGATITDIAVEGDIDHVVVTLGGTSTSNKKVRESWNATGGSPTFADITGSGANKVPNGLPCYSVVVDRDDPSIIVIGTELGVLVTEDGGTNWEYCSDGFGNVPVFDMRQNWRTFNEGCNRPGEIYIGTHGRGIWSTEAYLGNPDQDNLSPSRFIPNINVYPNPLNDHGTIAFTLENNADVMIQVFNLSGQLVKEISQANMAAGENNITFGAAELPKGAYIIRMTAGDRVETSKFIKH